MIHRKNYQNTRNCVNYHFMAQKSYFFLRLAFYVAKYRLSSAIPKELFQQLRNNFDRIKNNYLRISKIQLIIVVFSSDSHSWIRMN